ncbi:hypothetical protein D0809_04110 [Flavobacterium circumlabens]|uniref:Yip1 domain-containing protein n=1 Tax=Flavobacterium circumlabens TaxID=2133765 RepID=A0A4Y7UIA4_9FLAO|nr:hypothetical protein [Flavobacterium circumlabens]TCN61073.1 hypothetical protein EV142_101660 [Flavobacterium circumlabens]TEB46185.1 hypothetical protein D0809_04110 [Flavobacterium circumlabens]
MKSTFFKFLALSIASILITEIFKKVIHFDDLLYNSLSEQLTSKQIENLLGFQKKWQWIGYVFIPIFLLIKTTIIATILYIGLFFFDKDLRFTNLWDIVLKAEFIFLLVPVFKIIWFYFFQPNYNLQDIQNFYPLCALNIVGYKDLETWFFYPFQTLNLFELAYIIYLGFQIGKLTGTNTDRGLKLVAYSYVPALLLWVVTIMFFTLNYS